MFMPANLLDVESRRETMRKKLGELAMAKRWITPQFEIFLSSPQFVVDLGKTIA
jgi:hypothetical protein